MAQHLNAKIKEIFTSIQGEGPYIGQKHTFVRFSKCNLNCKYCDTDFTTDTANYCAFDLYNVLSEEDSQVVSFTGGEPLVEVDFLLEFLREYKEKLNKTIYLETNGTCYKELSRIIDFVDIIAMDIKLESATGQKNNFLANKEFLNIALKKEVFCKVVFDNNITEEEIHNIVNIAKPSNTKIILQPKMPLSDDLELEKIFNKLYNQYPNVFLIAQMHKFLNLA